MGGINHDHKVIGFLKRGEKRKNPAKRRKKDGKNRTKEKTKEIARPQTDRKLTKEIRPPLPTSPTMQNIRITALHGASLSSSLLLLCDLLTLSLTLLRSPIFVIKVFILPDPRIAGHADPFRFSHPIELCRLHHILLTPHTVGVAKPGFCEGIWVSPFCVPLLAKIPTKSTKDSGTYSLQSRSILTPTLYPFLSPIHSYD